MTSTYAINTTRGKEFEVEADLKSMGLHPWVPRQLCVKHVKERKGPVWYDRPYVGKLMFCVFPAVYFRDVSEHKHVIGKPSPLSEHDINGVPEYGFGPIKTPFRPGLRHFKQYVEAEYSEMERMRINQDWVCGYRPGQALKMLDGPFEGLPTVFKDTIKRAEHDFAMLRVEVSVFGRMTPVEVAPDMVKVA